MPIRNEDRSLEVIVIGGGPGGSSAATSLAQRGHRALVLEKTHFPRFHVGESLLPYSRALLEEMGLWPHLANAGFPRKLGAQFHLANGSKSRRFSFRDGTFTRHTEVVQVERSTFDHLLLQHARECGAEVREGWTVNRFTESAEGVVVQATDSSGQEQTLRASYLIDASGRANLTGNQQDLRQPHRHHRKCAVFGHFTGVRLSEGEAAGDTVIVRDRAHWFWIIPVSAEKTSVGLVLDQTALRGDEPVADLFHRTVAASRVMGFRMAQAALDGELRITTDFSYYNRRLVSERLLRVGDAAGFLDPIFSAGVHLALWSGQLAAESIHRALTSPGKARASFRPYERRVLRAMKLYWRMVAHFYTTPFMELFLEPRSNLRLPDAVVAILAGELEGGWRLRWRLELFYLLIHLQSRFHFAPRISWEPRKPRLRTTPTPRG